MTSQCLLIKALQSYDSLPELEPTAPRSLIPASSSLLGKSSPWGFLPQCGGCFTVLFREERTELSGATPQSSHTLLPPSLVMR